MEAESETGSVYRALVVLGTLLFRDEECTGMANSLEIADVVKQQISVHAADPKILRCATEVLEALEDPEK